MRVELKAYVLSTLKSVKINSDPNMVPLDKCEEGSFVTYKPPYTTEGRMMGRQERYRALVLQRTTEFGTTNERFVIVYLGSYGGVEYDVVSLDTLRPVSSDEPEGKRARF